MLGTSAQPAPRGARRTAQLGAAALIRPAPAPAIRRPFPGIVACPQCPVIVPVMSCRPRANSNITRLFSAGNTNKPLILRRLGMRKRNIMHLFNCPGFERGNIVYTF